MEGKKFLLCIILLCFGIIIFWTTNNFKREIKVSLVGNYTALDMEPCRELHRKMVSEMKSRKPSNAENLQYFKTFAVGQPRAILVDLIKTFLHVATTNDITYFMHEGTLIGSYRHHGLIPWDDDIDFLIPDIQMSKLVKILSNLGPPYAVTQQERYLYKFFFENSTAVPGQSWHYPYIDLYFYIEYDTSIFFVVNLSKSLIFPLIKRPFWNFSLPAPKNAMGVFKKVYGNFDIENCETQRINHKNAKYNSKIINEKCHHLWDRFPFVFRCKTMSGKGTNETLWKGDQLLSWKVFL